MRPYIYEAEYISGVAQQHYLNVDLGFRTWTVIPFYITNTNCKDYKPGDKLLIETKPIDAHKPRRYACTILY